MTSEEHYLLNKYLVIVKGLIYLEQAKEAVVLAQIHNAWTPEEKQLLDAASSLLGAKFYKLRNDP